jgi:hypothetical protein
MTALLEFRLAAPLPLQNRWERMHWAERKTLKKLLAWEIRSLLAGQIPEKPINFVHVQVWRRSISEPDQDGLIVKALLDVLQPSSQRHPYGLGIIKDDKRSNCISSINHVQVKHRTEQCTRVVIRELYAMPARQDEAISA